MVTVTFAELIKAGELEIGDGYRAKNSELGGSGPIFLRAGHLTDAGFDFDNVERFREEVAGSVLGKMAAAGDTVVTTKGNSTGRVGFVESDFPPFVYSPHLSYWRSRGRAITSSFLRYWSRADEFRKQLDAMKTSTDMAPYLSLTDQRRLRITLPSPRDQVAIGEVLTPLDDKLASNTAVNRTLESFSRAIFRSWFIDFDPVAAKRDGRRPVGVPTDALDLFPSHFRDSELGPIPQGWRTSTIGAEVAVVGGSTPSTREPRFWNGDVCWVTPRDLSRLADPIVLNSERRITEEGLAQISSGLLPAGTVLLSSRAPIGYIAVAEVPVAINQGFIAMRCDRLSPQYVVNWTWENLDEVLSRAGGTTFAEISKAAFRPIPLVVPPESVLAAFDTIAAPLHAMLVENVRESRTLVDLRDALLTPLLSGELTIKAAEKAVEAAI